MMAKLGGAPHIERDGWSLVFPAAMATLGSRPGLELIERSLRIAAGAGGEPVRRSRHASTYQVRLGAPPYDEAEVFVKLLDPPSRLKTVRGPLKASRAERLFEIVDALEAAGFAVPPLLMLGEERRGGRTMMATARIAGQPLPRYLLGARGSPQRKRAVLRALGAEVARLHRAGFVHGDLTPYNIFVADGAPVRFVFIDHERTARPPLVWRRRRLRNLVQLCRFDLKEMSRTDRLRIVRAYADAMGDSRRRLVRRVAAMLRARTRRDTAAGPAVSVYGGSWRRPV